MRKIKLNQLTKGAIIAALYIGLSVSLAPIGTGILQFRVAEALTLLPMLTAAAIPGLAVGCFLGNYITMLLSGGAGMVDVVLGTLATLLAAICTRLTRKNKWLAAAFPVIFNGLIVGGYLHYLVFPTVNLWLCMLLVAMGESGVTYLLGIPLMQFVKNKMGDFIHDGN